MSCHRSNGDNLKIAGTSLKKIIPWKMGSDRSEDDTLKIASSSFKQFNKKFLKTTLWSFLRTTMHIMRCHPSPFLLHYLRSHRYHRWHLHWYVYISKRWQLLKHVLHGRWQRRKCAVVGEKMTTHKARCQLFHRWQRTFEVVIFTDDNPKNTLWSFHRSQRVYCVRIGRWHPPI